MNRHQIDHIINEHFDYYEATDDVDGVLATLTDDATHHVVGSPWGELTGQAAGRALYEDLFSALAGEHVEPVTRWYGDDFAVDETLWTGTTNDSRAFGNLGKSGHATFRLLHRFELRDGLISTEKVWVDTVAIASQVT